MNGVRRVLVVCATGTGCTESVARWMADEVAADGAEAVMAAAKDAPSPSGFDGVILGSGLRAGKWHPDAERWAVTYAEDLRSLPCAFFSVGMAASSAAGDPGPGLAAAQMVADRVGIHPVATASLAGWFVPKRFSLPERLILKAMKTPQGDFRDESAVRAWTDDALAKMGFL